MSNAWLCALWLWQFAELLRVFGDVCEQQLRQIMGILKELLVHASSLSSVSPEKSDAAELIISGSEGSPSGNAAAIARLHISAVVGAPIASRASVTNPAVSELRFAKYCEKPPLFTSDSSAQIEENTFCGND